MNRNWTILTHFYCLSAWFCPFFVLFQLLLLSFSVSMLQIFVENLTKDTYIRETFHYLCIVFVNVYSLQSEKKKEKQQQQGNKIFIGIFECVWETLCSKYWFIIYDNMWCLSFLFLARALIPEGNIFGEGNLAWRENVMHLQYYIKDFFLFSFRKYARKKRQREEEAYFFYPHSFPRKIFQCLSFSLLMSVCRHRGSE